MHGEGGGAGEWIKTRVFARVGHCGLISFANFHGNVILLLHLHFYVLPFATFQRKSTAGPDVPVLGIFFSYPHDIDGESANCLLQFCAIDDGGKRKHAG